MPYRYLLPLNADTVCSQETAKQDKIEITIGEWLINGDLSAARHVADRLAHTALFMARPDGGRQPVYPFNEVRGQRGQSPSVKFSALDLRTGGQGKPLVQGTIRFRPSGDSAETYRVKAEISVNPTRMLEVVPPRTAVFANFTAGETIAPGFIRRHQIRTMDGEFPLRPADNYISHGRVIRRYQGQAWQTFVRQCFEQIDRGLHLLLERAANDVSIPIQRSCFYSLKSVETYWEFRHPDPIAFMTALSPIFRSLGKSGRLIDYRIENSGEAFPRDGLEYNSPCLTIDLRADASLKIYAKTNRRVRFEITTKHARDPHTATHLYDIVELIFNYSRNAAALMPQIMSNLFATISPIVDQMPPHSLLTAIVSATEDEAEQQTLASSLILTGMYEKVPNQAINAAIDRLKQRGVIMPIRRGSRCYRLGNAYQRARAALRDTFEDFMPPRA